jgi:hypothetical protein
VRHAPGLSQSPHLQSCCKFVRPLLNSANSPQNSTDVTFALPLPRCLLAASQPGASIRRYLPSRASDIAALDAGGQKQVIHRVNTCAGPGTKETERSSDLMHEIAVVSLVNLCDLTARYPAGCTLFGLGAAIR